MRRLSSNSRKNQTYKAFREVGRVMRTVALLRFLADSGLRARVTAATNKAEAYNGFSAWTPVRQPGRDRRERPGRAGKSVKWNSLLCNVIVFHAIDMMEVIRPGCRGVAGDRGRIWPSSPSPDLPHPPVRRLRNGELHIPPDVFDPRWALVRDRRRLDAGGSAAGPIPAPCRGASAMLWAWSTCPECRDRRWTG